MPWLRNSLTPAAIFRGRTFILVSWVCVSERVCEVWSAATATRAELQLCHCSVQTVAFMLPATATHWGNSNTEATATTSSVQFSLGPCTGTSTFGHNCMLMHETLIACPRDATPERIMPSSKRVSPCNAPSLASQLHFTILQSTLSPSTVFHVRSFIFSLRSRTRNWSLVYAVVTSPAHLVMQFIKTYSKHNIYIYIQYI